MQKKMAYDKNTYKIAFLEGRYKTEILNKGIGLRYLERILRNSGYKNNWKKRRLLCLYALAKCPKSLLSLLITAIRCSSAGDIKGDLRSIMESCGLLTCDNALTPTAQLIVNTTSSQKVLEGLHPTQPVVETFLKNFLARMLGDCVEVCDHSALEPVEALTGHFLSVLSISPERKWEEIISEIDDLEWNTALEGEDISEVLDGGLGMQQIM